MMYPDRPPIIPVPPHGYYNDPNMRMGPLTPNMPPHGPDMLGGLPPDMMVGPPPPMSSNDHYRHPPPWGPPDMRHYRPPFMDSHIADHPPPPHFHPGYRDEHSWRPREPWRGHGHRIPGKNKIAIFIAFLLYNHAKNLPVLCSLKNKSYVQCDATIRSTLLSALLPLFVHVIGLSTANTYIWQELRRDRWLRLVTSKIESALHAICKLSLRR